MNTVIYCEDAWDAWLALPPAAKGTAAESGSDRAPDAAGLERLLMAIVAMLETSFPDALVRTRELISRIMPGRAT